MKIIPISGKAQHGKDTVANLIATKLEKLGASVLIVHYGDLLKFICEKYFNWNKEKDDEGRALLQFIGTDVIREETPNYWVDFIIDLVSRFEHEWDYILIPDTRFPNEVERWAGWDVVSLRVYRESFVSSLTTQQLAHASETSLDSFNFDYTISAQSGMDYIEKEVDKFLEWLEKTI